MTTTSVQAAPAAALESARGAETLLSSTIGRKAVMAITGVILVVFVIGHMLGNLQVYLGPAALDAYGALLRELLHGTGLWIVRAALLLAVGLHIWDAWSLTRAGWKARPVGYRRMQHQASTYASRTMRWSGPILALFVIYHLLHLTVGSAHPSFEEERVYHNVVAGFSVWPASAFYVLAMLALGVHMYHGIWSMTQTVGWSHPRYDRWRRALATSITLAVVAGNISIPVAVLIGLVR